MMNKLALLKFLFVVSTLGLNAITAPKARLGTLCIDILSKKLKEFRELATSYKDNSSSSIVTIAGDSYKQFMRTPGKNLSQGDLTLILSDSNQNNCGKISGYFSGNTLHLQQLHVNAALRNKGLGAYLMSTSFGLAKEKKMDTVKWLALPPDNNYDAMKKLVNWYQKLGGIAPQGVHDDGTPMHYIINKPTLSGGKK